MPLASFVGHSFVDCKFVPDHQIGFDAVLVDVDHNLGFYHKEGAVHSFRCLLVQHDMVRKTESDCRFGFAPQEAHLCLRRPLWTAHTRNRLLHRATSSVWKQTEGKILEFGFNLYNICKKCTIEAARTKLKFFPGFQNEGTARWELIFFFITENDILTFFIPLPHMIMNRVLTLPL